MTNDRLQRQIERLLDEADKALTGRDWNTVRERASDALAIDPDNAEAQGFLSAAERSLSVPVTPDLLGAAIPAGPPSIPVQPTSLANGRYTVTRFLGEGGKKKVYLARDSLLDRDVALALIKTEGLDEAARQRVSREAQAMGRLGAHPNIVTVFDIGEESGQPFLILPVMSGGDVEGLIEDAPEHRLTLERAVTIAIDTCKGLEFAHSKGIVHRDLKPGNIWLTEDGRAMIGDFGLAVAVDKSRLTQAGMMVGTVNYMPPEQAMGGEVGPRSDLYSLGAMLYEMVCGRPPFVGDESVAIIGQHLNTPPVAPSWHRPDCPPALEALILRLLEKDPTKRPASATEVREALESVTATATTRQPTVEHELPAGDNPLYRRTFVGRENEVRQLQQAFDAALSGQGGLVMVVGEPGIGKTALCEQLATYVALRGGKALVGHCYEEGSLSLPYLAFVEAMRTYVLAREPDGLRTDLGSGAADVARIVSEVRDRVQGVELRSDGDPEDDRWRLLHAVTSFLSNASTVQPLCIVLEDLHWADRGTLDLLLHASRNLQGARLLVVGTYRDVEVDRSHPLSSTLADLRRGANFSRVPLRGLTVDEVHRMYESLRGNDVPWAQAEQVHRQTEGNPLFVQEVLRYLVEEGVVVRADGRYVVDADSDVTIPEGLRDVVGKRLSRIGAATSQTLSLASVMGRDFRLDILQGISLLGEDELFAALEEAQERAIIEQRHVVGTVGFRFSHSFFRQTLYEEIFTPRRIRMHQQVGRALEELYARRLEEHASELAEHFSQSTEAADLEKAVNYSELAAQRSLQVFAYGEAVRQLELALRAQEVLDPDDHKRRANLFLDLGRALIPAGERLRAGEEVFERAFQMASAAGEQELCADACGLAVLAIHRHAAPLVLEPVVQTWFERAKEYVRPGTLNSIWIDSARQFQALVQGNAVEADQMRRHTLTEAKTLGDPSAMFEAATNVLAQYNPLSEDGISGLPLEVVSWPRTGVSSEHVALCLDYAASVLLGMGQRLMAEQAWQAVSEISERAHTPLASLLKLKNEGTRLHLDGQLGESISLSDRLFEQAQEAGLAGRGNGWRIFVSLRPRILLGQATDFQFVGAGRLQPLLQAFQLAQAGETEEARQILVSSYATSLAGGGVRFHNTGVTAWALEVAILTDTQEIASDLLLQTAEIAGRISLGGLGGPVAFGRLLGEASVMFHRPDEARAYYAQGLAVSQKVRFRPEIALIRLDIAELLLEHYPDEHDAAIEDLDFAIAELRDMKMQPALERALRHRGLLKA